MDLVEWAVHGEVMRGRISIDCDQKDGLYAMSLNEGMSKCAPGRNNASGGCSMQ